jgi:hypothetical protein
LTATEDLFTPIHKAIRSMIYDLGSRLQRADFADAAASSAVLADLEHEFANAVSATCILCLLDGHADAEETGFFPPMQPIDPGLIRMLIDEHHEVRRRLVDLTKDADELGAVDEPKLRIELGARINREANEFFAFYLTHMNKEEATIVPAMKEHFTDAQMRAMHGAIMRGLPRERMAGYWRWMLPSLTMGELTAMLSGLKHGAPPEVLQLAMGIGEANVNPTRWAAAREQVGL